MRGDVATMKNDDRLPGQAKGLKSGILSIKTDRSAQETAD